VDHRGVRKPMRNDHPIEDEISTHSITKALTGGRLGAVAEIAVKRLGPPSSKRSSRRQGGKDARLKMANMLFGKAVSHPLYPWRRTEIRESKGRKTALD